MLLDSQLGAPLIVIACSRVMVFLEFSEIAALSRLLLGIAAINSRTSRQGFARLLQR